MKKIGFIGAGNMAFAMLKAATKALKDVGFTYTDINKERLAYVESETGVQYCEDNIACVNDSDVVILAIKPQYYSTVFSEIASAKKSGKIFISIAPGITMDYVKDNLGDVRVVRAMPNTPAMVGEGMTGVCYDENTISVEEINLIHAFFNSFGKMILLKENQLDMIVPVSGSSPAYVYMMIEAMADAGVLFGLPRDAAYLLASQTLLGSAKMVLETGMHPGVLKDQVTSPGGTTIEAVKTLESEGFRAAIINAMKDCYDKTLKFK